VDGVDGLCLVGCREPFVPRSMSCVLSLSKRNLVPDPMHSANYHLPWKRITIALLLFGTAFGYLEASVVTYLRSLHEPVVQRFYPNRVPGDLFPLLTLDQIRTEAPQQIGTLAIEIGREVATLAMLAAIALAVARNAGQWAAAFVIAFGTWDITFYLFLKALLGWPASILTWDILFLVPVPWVGPVLAPVLVSVAMIVVGLWHFRRESSGNGVRVGVIGWVGILAGAVVIVVAFAMDYRQIMAGGMPHPFNWPVFGLGMMLGVGSYVRAAVGGTSLAATKAAARQTMDERI